MAFWLRLVQASRRTNTATASRNVATWIRLAKIVVASGVMGGVLWCAALAAGPWIAAGGIRAAACLAALVGLGVVVYGAVALGLRATTVAELRVAFRR